MGGLIEGADRRLAHCYLTRSRTTSARRTPFGCEGVIPEETGRPNSNPVTRFARYRAELDRTDRHYEVAGVAVPPTKVAASRRCSRSSSHWPP